MNNNSNLSADCKKLRSYLPDLLLDAGSAVSHPELISHLSCCTECSKELAELKSTYFMLDEFTAPEPSPYFDSKLHARLREAQSAAPESFWERISSFLQFSTGRHLRPALAGALALVMVAGGAGVANINGVFSMSPVQASSTINDLKVMDNNESAEQLMGQLLDVSGSEDGDGQPTS
jgi:hypothetical protein